MTEYTEDEKRLAREIVAGMKPIGPSARFHANDAALAAIRETTKRAIRSAMEYADWHENHDDGLSGLDKMGLGAREIAENLSDGGHLK